MVSSPQRDVKFAVDVAVTFRDVLRSPTTLAPTCPHRRVRGPDAFEYGHVSPQALNTTVLPGGFPTAGGFCGSAPDAPSVP